MKSSSIFQPSRRSFLLGTGAAALCTPAIFTSARADDRVILTRDAGGPVAKAYTAAYYEPFEKETGIKVIGIPSARRPWRWSRASSRPSPTLGTWWAADVAHRPVATRAIISKRSSTARPSDESGRHAQRLRRRHRDLRHRALRTGPTRSRTPQSYADFWNVKDFLGRRAMRKCLDGVEQGCSPTAFLPSALSCDLDAPSRSSTRSSRIFRAGGARARRPRSC